MENRITKELVVAGLISTVTQKNMNGLVVAAEKMIITPETLSDNYEILKQLREIWNYLDERRKSEDKPEKERIAARKEGYDSIMKPIEKLLERIEPELIAVNDKIQEEDRLKLADITKKNDVRTRHVEFVNEITKSVTVADDNKELARLQMLVGTEKSKKKFYGDYYKVIEATCDELLSLIDNRKKIIKDNTELLKKQEEAKSKGDEALAVSLMEEIEYNVNFIRQNAEALANDALKMVSEVSMIGADFTSNAITPRLHRLSYKVTDINTLAQRMPDLVEKVPNVKAINDFMAQMKESGELNLEGVNEFPGLTIYNKKFYVSVKTTKDA
jgi:hypothetical protein